jgi:hypothetical protein
MARSAENVVAFYNKRGTCEQWIKEGKGAIKWTRLSCRSFAVRLQFHALAYNLGNFLRTLATPEPIEDWSMTTLKEKQPWSLRRLPDGRGRHLSIYSLASLRLIAELRPPPIAAST